MNLLLTMALVMIQVTGPNGNRIDVNPNDIVSLRQPQTRDFYDPRVKCIVYTLDATFVGTQETCEQVRNLLIQVEEQ